MVPRKIRWEIAITRLAVVCSLLFLTAAVTFAQQASPSPQASAPTASSNPEFLAEADEVLHDMSKITGWELKSPLKKSIRSRDEIRAYILREMDEEKDAKERYASTRSAEAFGLIPRGFQLDSFLVDLLTEEIAGLYDPKTHEFYIADWIAPDEQRTVMSHELTHALEDQYFHIEEWTRAARPNDDAELAREAVLEGSATAAMLEYELRDKGIKLRDLPEFDPSIFVGDLADTPTMKKAPRFIKDSLVFPYFSGLTFSLTVLKSGGWPAFASVFARPPANTQQILHPALYKSNKIAPPIKLDLPAAVPGNEWVLLEENSLGEFGWQEVLKQFLDEPTAKQVAAGWNGDIYATFENKGTKAAMLFARLRLSDDEAAEGFFKSYADALVKKYPERSGETRSSRSLAFSGGGTQVFFTCHGAECVTLEGGQLPDFRFWLKKLGWPEPAEEKQPASSAPGLVQTGAPRSTCAEEKQTHLATGL